jgi:serine/threonine-protein kinase
LSNLEFKSEGDTEVVCLRLSGVIDDKFEAKALLDALAPISILDLEGIKRITSFGVRQWSEAMKTLPSQVKHLYLVRCQPSFVDQLNMVLNFGGRAEVISTVAIYFCEECQEERNVPIDVLADRAQISTGHTPPANCPTCSKPLVLDENPQQYYRFVQTYGAKSLEPAAAALMAKLKLYEVRHVDRPPEEVKLVHGDVTLFCLAGTLDSRFRPRRLASGVEGSVVFDLREVEGVDPEGAGRWQKLLDDLTGATLIVIVDLPEVLLGPAAAGMFSLKRTILHSVCARYRCGSCGNEMRESLVLSSYTDERVEVCSRCGKNAPLTTDRALIKRLVQQRPASEPAIPSSVKKTIGERAELLSRARAESGASQRPVGDGLARYRVVRPLSQGGMAEILLAVHQGIGGFEKLIALKKIRKELLERRHIAIELFLNEAKIAANLSHPNIVQVFEVGEHGGDLFIAMEYVHGVDVRELMRQGLVVSKPLSIEQALFIGGQVAGALHYAHNARDLTGSKLNIVHRDVSLSNIVVGHDGQVKLVDFGIATASVVAEAQDGLVGKLSYMSPEQVASGPLDGRSDMFSLGIVLHEMIARRPLFRRKSDRETLEAVLDAPIPSLTQFGAPPSVDAVVMRALARKKEERFPDARSLELAITDCLQQMKSGVDAHQISVYMRELFGDKAARPPVETPPTSPEPLRGATPANEPSSSAPAVWSGNRPDDRTVIDTSPPSGLLPKKAVPPEPLLPAFPPPPARPEGFESPPTAADKPQTIERRTNWVLWLMLVALAVGGVILVLAYR